MAQILPFPTSSDTPPLAFFVRFGSAYKRLADLYAAGRLRTSRVVLNASRLAFQEDFLRKLHEDGVEIVLDTEIAELSTLRKFAGHSRSSPWLKADWARPFQPTDFLEDSVVRLAEKIATFAISRGVRTVLSPAHFLNDRSFSGWFEIDRMMCLALRKALDALGGKDIAIDYPVIVQNSALKDVAIRGDILSSLADLPIENVWVRTSGMDGSGGPLKTIQYLSNLERFHNIGRPVVADYLGGITGLAALSFGAVSGVAHGIGEMERFDASDWHLPPEERDEESGGFGPTPRVEVPNLGKAPTKRELELLAAAPGGRRLCSCSDKDCCPHGLDDMLRDPRSHAAVQATTSISRLQNVGVPLREKYFIEHPMAETVRTARSLTKLRIPEAEAERLGVDGAAMMKRYTDHSHKIDKIASALENYHERRTSDANRSKPIGKRNPVSNPKVARNE